jgi:uncharacterized protein YukE
MMFSGGSVTRTLSLLTAAVLVLGGGALSADSSETIERALGPYYAALVSSARGNIDATSRHLLVFASRWESISREAHTSPQAAVAQDPQWPALLDEVNAVIVRTRQLVHKQDLASAHAELETVRAEIRDFHARHNALTFDDHLTDYHEAMERVLGHVAGRNEIRLTARDFADAGEDLQAALAAWQAVQISAGPLAGNADWKAAVREAAAALDQAGKALSAKHATAAGAAAERMKTTYYDLLMAIAKARG